MDFTPSNIRAGRAGAEEVEEVVDRPWGRAGSGRPCPEDRRDLTSEPQSSQPSTSWRRTAGRCRRGRGRGTGCGSCAGPRGRRRTGRGPSRTSPRRGPHTGGPRPRCRSGSGGVWPAGQEVPSQLGVLEQLAVEGDPDRAVLIADRLPAAGEVDDREPPRPQDRRPARAWACSSSGPRWAIAPVIARSRGTEKSRRPSRSKAPAIPHMIRASSEDPTGTRFPIAGSQISEGERSSPVSEIGNPAIWNEITGLQRSTTTGADFLNMTRRRLARQ